MNNDFIWLFAVLCVSLFFVVYVFLKYYIKFAEVHKIYAHPSNRSAHDRIIPTGGGIVFGLFHVVFMLVSVLGIDDVVITESIYKICFGALFVILLGVLDDKYNIRAKYKFSFQIMIALLMIILGFRITNMTNPFGGIFYLNYLSIPITILWYLLVMNAINMIDGLDGLSTGITIITCLVLMVFSFHTRTFLVFLNCAMLVASLLAFLRYNFSPAKLFMGDTGSLFIGFLLASLSIAGNEEQFKGLTTYTLLVPLTVILIPLADAVFTIFRRLINKQHIFKADKNHIHHKLIDFGLSHKTVTFICWLITLFLGLIALGYMFISTQMMFMILIIIGIITLGLFFYIYKKELFK